MAISDEDQLIQRVPLAVPIVRILQVTSKEVLEREVPGIIAKIASFLRSKVTTGGLGGVNGKRNNRA